jgi:pimeloyl-ACP methyl ester carboxylesterase
VSPYSSLTEADSEIFMQKLIQAHFENLYGFHQETGEKVVVIGHSLGAFFSLRLLEQADDLIEKVILLHPFLRKPTSRGQLILKTTSLFYQRENWQKKVIKYKRYLELLARDLSYVTNEEVIQAFHIVKHEKRIIGEDESPILIAETLRRRLFLFYNAKDIWCSPVVVNALKNQIASEDCIEPHGFVTEQKHRASLFAKILRVNHL